MSTREKAVLAEAAGAQHVVNYREPVAEEAIRAVTPTSEYLIVEVAPVTKASLNQAVMGRNQFEAIYASERDDLTISDRSRDDYEHALPGRPGLHDAREREGTGRP